MAMTPENLPVMDPNAPILEQAALGDPNAIPNPIPKAAAPTNEQIEQEQEQVKSEANAERFQNSLVLTLLWLDWYSLGKI